MENAEPNIGQGAVAGVEPFAQELNRGLTLLANRRADEAVDAFARAAALERNLPDPTSDSEMLRRVHLYEPWGRALTTIGRNEQARWQNKKAVESLLTCADLVVDVDPQRALQYVDFAREINERDPSFAASRWLPGIWMRGYALLALERYEDAVEHLHATLDLANETERDDVLTQVHLLLGIAEEGRRRYGEAVKHFEEARRGDPGIALFAQNAGFELLWRRGKYHAAWQMLSNVERLERTWTPPANPQLEAAALYQLGLARFWRYEFEEADTHFEESKRLNSANVVLWATLINFYLERREHEPDQPNEWYWKAREAYERTRRRLELQHPGDTNDPLTLLKLGVLSTALGDDAVAESYFDRVVALGMHSETVEANLGLIALRRGEPRTAVRHFDAAVRADPDDLVKRRMLGDACARLELFERAETEYREILRTAPGYVEARIGLGELAIARADAGRTDFYLDAIEQFDEVLRLDDEMNGPVEMHQASTRLSSRQRAAVLYSRGYARARLYEQRGRRTVLGPFSDARLITAARRDFEAALDVDPGHFMARRAYEKTRRQDGEIAKRLIEEWGPLLAAALSLVILISIQIAFFTRSPQLGQTHYVGLTLGLLMFTAAALYLPNISSLKVGGAEFQKTIPEQVTAPVALGLERVEARATNVHFFSNLDWGQASIPEDADTQAPLLRHGQTTQKSPPRLSRADYADRPLVTGFEDAWVAGNSDEILFATTAASDDLRDAPTNDK